VTGPNDISAVDPRRLWLLRHEGAALGSESVSVFRSTNGGAGWQRVACTATQLPIPGAGACPFGSGLKFGGREDSLTFANASHGWITVNNTEGRPWLYVTSNGGAHWSIQRLPLPRGVLPAAPAAGRNVFVQYQRPVVFGQTVALPVAVTTCVQEAGPSTSCRSALYALLSFDAGRSWTGSRSIPSDIMGPGAGPLQLGSAKDWWSVAVPHLWVTNDAGLVWRSIGLFVPGDRKLLQFQFVSPEDGWALAGQVDPTEPYARNVVLLRTTDGGVIWTQVRLPGPGVPALRT
jgi:photosystem II stability/assembly factor-like uncharacterized protein